MESSDTIETPAHREQTTDSTEEEALAGVQVSDTTTSDGDERSRLLLGSPQRGDESLPDRGFNQDPGPSVERHQDWEGSEGEGERLFNTAITTQHTYLGDVDDVYGGFGKLKEGYQCCLPIICNRDVVLFPGSTLPLKIRSRNVREAVEMASASDPPLTNLLAVANASVGFGISTLSSIGCTAEIRQMGQNEGGEVTLIAVGLQRIKVDAEDAVRILAGDQLKGSVSVLRDHQPGPMPLEIQEAKTYWSGWVARMYDAHHLAYLAYNAAKAIFPKINCHYSDPLGLSYWIAINLPFDIGVRQLLLKQHTVLDRLRTELEHIKDLSKLVCAQCLAVITYSDHMLTMSEEGTSGIFVNPSGWVFDMITVSSISNAEHYGNPETEHSWFPGYAWTMVMCSDCGKHLGWYFTAVEKGLIPRAFWGLRREQLRSGKSFPNMQWLVL